MILTGAQILEEMKKGNISILPFNNANLNPNSCNLTLDKRLIMLDGELDMRVKPDGRELIIPDEGLVLMPGKLYLASTVEYTETLGFVPILFGRSSLSRLGLAVHATGGFGDVGFKGNWTMSLHCVLPTKVYRGAKICQIVYNTVMGETRDYDGKYQGGRGIQEGKIFKELR